MVNTTWNPSDLSAVTLSGGNLTASSTGAGWVRAVDRQITGKFYWEFKPTSWAGSDGHGFVRAGVTPSGATPVGMVALYSSGNIWINNVNSGASLGLRANNDIIGLAVDLAAKLVWFRVAPSGNWNGSAGADPATGVGGVLIQAAVLPGFPVYPVAAFSGTGPVVVVNFGDTAFTGTVPSGFTSGFTAGATIVANAIATQSALEQFASTNPPAQVTQVAFEQWATTATISGQAMVTQVALEQWVPAARPTIDLAGNLGGVSQFGRLKYGLKHYSRIDAFAPAFSADLTVVAALNLAGGLTPTIVLAADLDVHVNLIELRGDLAPQIALEGALSLLVPLDTLLGSFGFEVVYGASSFISGPLWAGSEPCPTPPWVESEPCPTPSWMTAPPCEPVAWKKTEMCRG